MLVLSGGTVSCGYIAMCHVFICERYLQAVSDEYSVLAYVADWKVQLEKGEPHEVKDHSVEVRLL
jgi:hypothetical protein